jgi:hypothetical protein
MNEDNINISRQGDECTSNRFLSGVTTGNNTDFV